MRLPSALQFFLFLSTPVVFGFSPLGNLVGLSSRNGLSKGLYSSTASLPPDGVLKTISKPGTGPQVKRGDIATVKYKCYLPDSPPFSTSESQRMTIGSGDMIDGWEAAIETMKVGERAIVRITNPALGYGEAGVPPIIPPNAEIELDLEIIESRARSDIDFDTLSIGVDPSTPRTAESIAAAYDKLMEKKALDKEPEKEGLEGFIEKAKGWYFFGLFEGETGQDAPWILRPTITFPIAFLIVGSAFLISYKSGGISERGVQSTDELDEIILTMTQTDPATATILSTAFLSLAMMGDVFTNLYF